MTVRKSERPTHAEMQNSERNQQATRADRPFTGSSWDCSRPSGAVVLRARLRIRVSILKIEGVGPKLSLAPNRNPLANL
jgi:hypothetical protein